MCIIMLKFVILKNREWANIQPFLFIKYNVYIAQCPPQTKGKAYWEGVSWVEPVTTSKLLTLPNSHIKEKSVP